MNNTYLCHYGVKGMKWGVRRYQYKNGSLTPEGMERYGVKTRKITARKFQYENGVLNERGKEEYRKRLEKIDTDKWASSNGNAKLEVLVDEINKTGIIPKGTIVYRQTQGPEKLGHDRKYVTLSLDASLEYSNPDMLVGGLSDNPRSYVYKTKRPLKIATDTEVENFVFSQYPEQESYLRALRDGRNYIYENLNRRKSVSDYGINRTSKDSIDALAMSYKDKVDHHLHKYFRHIWHDSDANADNPAILYKLPSKTHAHFAKLGYDAISDIEDGGLQNGDYYPVVILDPKKSLSVEIDMPEYRFWNYWKEHKDD